MLIYPPHPYYTHPRAGESGTPRCAKHIINERDSNRSRVVPLLIHSDMEKEKDQKLPDSKMSEIEVTYKNNKKYQEMPQIKCSADVNELLRSVWSNRMEHVEEFVLLCLNRANKLLGWIKVSSGGVTGCLVDPKVIYQVALKVNACGLILAHNHPSGNKTPSESDRALTKKLKGAGKVLDIPVLDHIILTAEDYFSFADEGIL